MLKLSRDLGIDMGTSNIVIYSEEKEIVLREPAVVAVEKSSGKLLQVGAAARNMLGRTPGTIVAMYPIRGGVISNYEFTVEMMAEFLRKVNRFSFIKPRVVVSVPSGISEVEERAVIQVMMEAGARRVYLIEAPLAAGIGAQLNLREPSGRMVIDIGGGTTDIAVLSLNGVSVSSSLRVGGEAFDEAIVKYLRKKYEIIIGSSAAEEIKMTIGGVYPRNDGFEMELRGRDTSSTRIRDVIVSQQDIMEAMMPVAKQIAEEVLNVLDKTSPELITDVSGNGITLTGGWAQIYGMDRYLADVTQFPCRVADEADSCVAYGCGKSLEWIQSMQEGPINIAKRKLLREQSR